MPGARLELASHYWQRLLRPQRIPFRHPGFEVTAGFEPAHSGFADRRVNQLRHVTSCMANLGTYSNLDQSHYQKTDP